ncbi:MAG: hypothetical protein IPP64_00655 [Bacteroidetes bacterium]|nr:hypothetical protein [Bacteroidota bacterium]
MQKTFFVSFFIFLTSLLLGQSIERKIIIQNGNYFFTTIDDNNQLATLHTGKDTAAIRNAKSWPCLLEEIMMIRLFLLLGILLTQVFMR